MQIEDKALFKLEIDENELMNIDGEMTDGTSSTAIQTIEFEILPPVDLNDKRRMRIYKEITDIDEKIKIINTRVEELNSEIDSLTNHADGMDYAFSAISGIIAGLMDSFFVGETNIDKEEIEKMLVKKYHTANDSGYMHKDDDGHWTSSAMYHRLDDLAHHPTPLGLVASILVRYFRLVVFIDGSDGKPHIFFADTSSPEVMAKEKKQLLWAWAGATIGGLCLWLTYVAEKKYEDNYDEEMPTPLKEIVKTVSATPMLIEILKTADTWIGHMMSDVSTPQGIPGIFLSLLKEISVLPGLRNTNLPVVVDGLYRKGKYNLSEWGGVVFTAAKKQAIPVLINEVLVRGFYFVRQLIKEFKENKTVDKINWSSVIPLKNRTVVRMLTIATGTFTAFDIADAAIRSGGFNAACLLRINFVGVGRFVIAIGTDVGMGIRKRKKEYERSAAITEYINLAKIKVYYRQADVVISQSEMHESEAAMHSAEQELWCEVQNNVEAMNQLYMQICKICEFYVQAINEMDQYLNDISALMQGIDKMNPGLREKMLERLK